MARILFGLMSQGGIAGGHKMLFRHVEALRELGYDAAFYTNRDNQVPSWFDHGAPVEITPAIAPDDIFVVPDDAPKTMRNVLPAPFRKVILSQNPYPMAAVAFDALDLYPADKLPTFIAVSEGLASTIRRAYPGAQVEIAPCFADERLFRPGPAKRFAVAYAPRKRPLEAQAIRGLFRKLHPRHADLEWVELNGLREAEVARAMGECELFLSLNRLESVGMTTLEAMASGCLCTGFLGVGGREYARPQNGLWVDEDDCEAAADALARAADLVRARSPELEAYRAAAFATAQTWSYARFKPALEAAWSRLAPGLRAAALC